MTNRAGCFLVGYVGRNVHTIFGYYNEAKLHAEELKRTAPTEEVELLEQVVVRTRIELL
jgi:hypothetical protein